MNPAPPVTMTCMPEIYQNGFAGAAAEVQIPGMQFGNSDQDRGNVEDRRGSIVTGGRLGLGGVVLLRLPHPGVPPKLFDLGGGAGAAPPGARPQGAPKQAPPKTPPRGAPGALNAA